MSIDLRVLHYLLGDSKRPGATVTQWLQATMRPGKGAEEQTITTALTDTITAMIDKACAQLYDAQLLHADAEFDKLVSITQTDTIDSSYPYFNLAGRLGASYCQILLKHHGAADQLLRKISERAAPRYPALTALASWWTALNLSDWGRSASLDLEEIPPTAELPSPTLRVLFRAERAYVLSRLLLRQGSRHRGLEVLDGVIGNKQFEVLAPIPRARLLRMQGILLDMSGDKTRARAVLGEALELCERAGYCLGQVQTAFSLTRVHLGLDRAQTQSYIKQAEDILNETDPVRGEGSHERQMFAERAALSTHKAQIEFSRGNIEAAVKLVREDIADIEYLAQQQKDGGLPRQLGQAHRHLGKMLLTQGRHSDAAKAFLQSVKHFERADDTMNVFFSRARLCCAYLEGRKTSGVERQILEMESALRSRKHREKEYAIVLMFKAAAAWLKNDLGLAKSLVSQAIEGLSPFGRDYYFARAVMLKGDVLASLGDRISAYQRYMEARRCALSVEAEDLRLLLEKKLADLGVTGPFPGLQEVELRREDLTILFADIRGFTGASAQMEPHRMANFIRDFAEAVSRCTVRHGGRPTRFFGDCVMALFGLPAASDQKGPKEQQALMAACEMDELFRKLRERWELHTPEFGKLGIGFGITSGSVVVGRFGWMELSEFSAIGDEVNLASRLQSLAEDGEINTCPRTIEVLRTRLASLRLVEEAGRLKGLGQQKWYRLRVDALLGAPALRAVP